MSRSRHIQLAGCFNLRDVGGYPTRGGKSLAWARLYRSGDFSDIRPSEAEELVHVRGIRRVIDLRAPAETEGAVFPLPPPCQHISLPLFDSFRQHWIRPPDHGPEGTASRYMEMIEEGLHSIGKIVERLSEPGAEPTIVHCAVGRDRTGIVMAVLLDLLDVPDDVIASDYSLSDGIVMDGARAHDETMHVLLRLLRHRYGSARQMLEGAGISSLRFRQLQEALVHDGVDAGHRGRKQRSPRQGGHGS